MLQSTGIDPYLTVAETVELYRGYYPIRAGWTRSSRSSGWRRSGTREWTKLSGGQQRRLDVAIALAG